MGAEVTMIIETDLECEKCSEKIHKVLSKGKERAQCCCCCICHTIFCRVTTKKHGKHAKKINTVICDKKKNTVSISGTFDPEKLERLLRCEACDAIKNITIVKKKKEEEKKKPEEEKKKPEEKKEKEEAVPTLTVTICTVCYPWPCNDPSHWGGVQQYPQHHQPAPWAAPPVTPLHGGMQHGWPPAMPTPVQMMQPPPMCVSGGPSSCRGCKGCRIVQEGKFSYEEYPQNSYCAIM